MSLDHFERSDCEQLPPSYWSGIAAYSIPFKDTADYARWACLLLELGHEGEGICGLASMEDESNLFLLREWHRKALRDLGMTPIEGAVARAAWARGQMEEFLAGRFSGTDLLQTLRDHYLDTLDTLLEPFENLHLAWWHLDEADWGFSSQDEIMVRLKIECEAFIARHQAEYGLCQKDGRRF